MVEGNDVPLNVDGEVYYRTLEVCHIAGVSRSTLFRWLKEGKEGEPIKRDWRGWRLFTVSQAAAIKRRTAEAQLVAAN